MSEVDSLFEIDTSLNGYTICNICGIRKQKSEYYSLKFSGKCKSCCNMKLIEKKTLKSITYRNQKSYEVLYEMYQKHPEYFKEYNLEHFINIK